MCNLFGASLLACCAPTLDPPAERGYIAAQDLEGSCQGEERDFCGGVSSGNCWCDDYCERYQDCCADKQQVCDRAPLTCEELGAECGEIDDGLGNTVDCGGCQAPETCGGRGQAKLCGCAPTTCEAQGAECGVIEDGCGGALSCGTCQAPETCGGRGRDNLCGCAPRTCEAAGATCGGVDDGCGGRLDCGGCEAPQTCGGGGQDNQCGCTPLSCEALGVDCGEHDDGCGGVVACGSCASGPGSIFDAGWAQGTPITREQALRYFEPAATRAALGDFVIRQRVRQCNQATGCADWVAPQDLTFGRLVFTYWNPGPGWSNQKTCWQFVEVRYPEVVGQMAFEIGQDNQILLRLNSEATGSVSCTGVTGARADCSRFEGSGGTAGSPASCYAPNALGSGSEPGTYPASVTFYDTGETEGRVMELDVQVTATYVYARQLYRGQPSDADGSYREVEYALYGSVDGSPIPGEDGPTCEPTTCAARGATCGTIDDGCGSTLNCGSCGYPYFCEQNSCRLPPSCNLQPCYSGASVAYTCCSSGQITCSNGRGCTCYDACY